MDDKESNLNPEPAAPAEISEPTPVEETIEVEVEEVVQTEQPLFAKQPADQGAPKKPKKKIGIIITICLAAVLLIGGAFTALFFSWRQSDSTVILDAVTGAIKETRASITGSVYVELNESDQSESGVKSVKIDIKSAQDGANVRAEDMFSIVTTDDKTISMSIGGAFISDGTFYIKLEGIKDVISISGDKNDVAIALDYLGDLIEDIDGEWYKISASDLSFSSEAEDAYNCLVDVANMADDADSNTEFAELYKKNPFIYSAKHRESDSKGNAVYDIMIYPDVFAYFVDGAKDTKLGKKLSECPIELLDLDLEDDYTPTPGDKSTISLHIDGWSHQLRGISMNSEVDGAIMNAELYLEYGDEVEVEIPENAKSVSDLMTSLEDAFKNYVIAATKEQGMTFCETYAGTAYYDQCLATFDAQIQDYLENMDFSELLKFSTDTSFEV